jgi:uncharacterized protein (DUF2267 family)
VKYEEFVERVAERADLDLDEGERTSIAVLQELCDRITGDEAYDLLSQLPAKLKTAIIVASSAIPLPAEEFVARVARALEVDEDVARTRIRAVFSTLREAVTWGELEDVMAQLEPEYADFLA